MNNIKIKNVNKEECHGCGNKNKSLKMILFPYATIPIYLCDRCQKELMDNLKNN